VRGGTEGYAVATFHSTHSVIKAEKLLKDAGLEAVRLVPVPSQVSSDCGVTVRFLRGDLDRARATLAGLGDDLEGFFLGIPGGWEPAS
jgi:hypothetical protein